jgi:cell division protease FtsH
MSSSLPKNFPGGAAAPAAGASALPKNFTPDMAPGAAAPAATAGPAQPEVTRAEIAAHFAQRVVALRDAARAGSTRPRLYVVELPYVDFMRDVAAAYAGATGAAFLPGADGMVPQAPGQSLVTLAVNPDLFVHYLNHGFDVTVFCVRAWLLPPVVNELRDATLTVPRFDAATFAAACADFFELPAPPALAGDTAWTAGVVPRDFLLASQATPAEAVAAVRAAMERRLARYAPDAALGIDDFSGMFEARDWASSLVDEILFARGGGLPWSEVESGVTLAGPRGVGKASLARAVARAAGIRYLETSVFNWMSTEKEPERGLHRLVADFQEALSAAPTVFFINDIELFGNAPWVGLMGPFVQHLQSLRGEPGLVVIGGAASAKAVPLTLRQHGALESIITVTPPNSGALAKMYERMLSDKQHALTASDFATIGRLSLGLTGDGIELVVRRALRQARKDGNRAVTKDDVARVLVQEIHGHESEDQRRLMAEDELRNTAYHEAGHAVLQLMRRRSAGLRYVTIVPREGSLGFMWQAVDESRNSETRQDMIDELRVMLAGRAAEEILGGKDQVTSGCTGDLFSAAHYVRFLLTRTGLHGLLSLDLKLEDSPELRAEAQKILDEEYAHVVAALRRHRALLDEVAELLIERQEVSGDELMALYARYREKNPGN